MYPENIKRKLEYKLRELELIIKQISRDAEVTGIDIDLALEKTRYLYDLLTQLKSGKSIPTGKPVVPSDPDPVEDNHIYEAEGIIPSPSGYMRREGPNTEKKETGKAPGKHPDEHDGGKEHAGDKDRPESRENPALGSSGDSEPGAGEKAPGEEKGAGDSEPGAGEKAPGEEKGAGDSEPGAGEKAPGEEKGAGDSEPGAGEKAPGDPSGETGIDPAAMETTPMPPADRTENGKVPSKTNKPDRPDDIEIIADKYQSSQNYINQAIASKQTRDDLTTRMRSRPISDLRNSIGLNDKFLFIKEIFKGRPENYNQCIDDLNKAASFEEALDIAKGKYSLDEKNEAVKKLLALVKRKSQDV
jgi:hypothetical protein